MRWKIDFNKSVGVEEEGKRKICCLENEKFIDVITFLFIFWHGRTALDYIEGSSFESEGFMIY